MSPFFAADTTLASDDCNVARQLDCGTLLLTSDTFDAVRADYHLRCEILTLVPIHDFGSDLDFLPVKASRPDQQPQSSGDVPGGPS